ncbi:chemotaxis response regulator protein-glutamate methylesterase [Burkholderia sp. JP2-270]|uniref:chemotaxis-specific protein-glutamate methyltransferase CheB n=1 Tax=Burkholderia sp. JP2-270 TaxID=2217913 RepID=UPI000DA33130|nr:chemotaxis-specific protein-glutamate methyltransferase CheB [Burkholderia sp. JP2-270]AWV05075.1 chemotaxis response regulator protein-glutamate methylesterase [Burkholderia sp. JP2-270]
MTPNLADGDDVGSFAPGCQIRVLIADDSAVAREQMAYLLNGDPQLVVVGVVNDGVEAVKAACALRPDVIAMDIHMPGLDGFAASRKIMETCPTRIVMITASSDPLAVAATFRTLEAGVLAVVAKPGPVGHPDFPAMTAELLRTVKAMSAVHVIKRWPSARKVDVGVPTIDGAAGRADVSRRPRPAIDRSGPTGTLALIRKDIRVVAVGASTGGPMALRALLARMPTDFPVPILVVQHIPDGFAQGFVEWLGSASNYPVRLAAHGIAAQPGIAHVAPAGSHMVVGPAGMVELVAGAPEHGLRPSVARLFRSVDAAFGAAAVGVLLTGMGRDGARELQQMRRSGALTIAQDRESSVVFGMPAAAIDLDAATFVLPPDGIAELLCSLFGLTATLRLST